MEVRNYNLYYHKKISFIDLQIINKLNQNEYILVTGKNASLEH